MANGEKVIEHFNSEKTALTARNNVQRAFNHLLLPFCIDAYLDPENHKDFWANKQDSPANIFGANKNDADLIKKIINYNGLTNKYGRYLFNAANCCSEIDVDTIKNGNDDWDWVAAWKKELLEITETDVLVPFASFKFLVKDANNNKCYSSGEYVAIGSIEFKSSKDKTTDEYFSIFNEFNKAREQYCKLFGTLFTSDLKPFLLKKLTEKQIRLIIDNFKNAIKNQKTHCTIYPCSPKQENLIASLCNNDKDINQNIDTNRFKDYQMAIQSKHLNNWQAKELIAVLYDDYIPDGYSKEDVIKFYKLNEI